MIKKKKVAALRTEAKNDTCGKMLSRVFKALADGSKPFEVRKNDRIYKTGDLLAVNEFLPEEDPYTLRSGTKEHYGGYHHAVEDGYYSGKCALFRITYVLDDPRFCKDGMVVLGLAQQVY